MYQRARNYGMRVAGPELLSRSLRAYGIQNTKPFINSYHAYVNAVRNTNNNSKRRNAKRAALRLGNGIFETYERSVAKSGPIAQGFRNGAIQSLLWWTPGVMARRVLPRIQTNLN